MTKEEFIVALNNINIHLTKEAEDALEIYASFLLKYNEHTNLTAIKTMSEIYLKHFYDSLTISKLVDFNNGKLLDVGTGAGFPGMVLAICFPNLQVDLLDSNNKKIKFLEELIKKLKKDFTIFISSNNSEVRIKPYLDELEIEGVSFSLKPFTRSFRKIRRKKFFKREEMVMIGDQIVTDILAGNRYKIKTILVDALGEKDLKITKLNRFIENKIVKRYQKKGLFERGKYYE